MSTVPRNAIANFIGKIWSTALGLAVIPLYIKVLGLVVTLVVNDVSRLIS